MGIDIFRLKHGGMIGSSEFLSPAGWQPLADVYESRGGWLIKFDLAGIRLEDIELSISGRALTVRGVRRDWSIAEKQQFHRLEISYNRFERVVELPCDLEQFQISTEYRDGMLLVRLTCEEAKR